MTHIYARSLVVVGLLLMMFAASQLLNAGRTYSAAIDSPPQKFLVAPKGTVFHSAGCKHIDPSLRNMTVTRAEAERCKFTPCEHCLTRESGTSRTSTASPPPAPTGTARPPSRDVGR